MAILDLLSFSQRERTGRAAEGAPFSPAPEALAGMELVFFLRPYFADVTKRPIKHPKMYFPDTGSCAYLAQRSSAAALKAGAMSGAVLETFTFSEIVKSYRRNAKNANMFFHRDRGGLVIESDGRLFPVEFKKSATPSIGAAKHFSALGSLPTPTGHGAVICLRDTPMPLSENVTAVPLRII